MVGEVSELLGAGADATVPTEEITPGVVWLLGKVMVTLSPTSTSDCWPASRAMLTCRVVEVAEQHRLARRGRQHPGWPTPRSPGPQWARTRPAPGTSVPFCASPRAAWSFSTPTSVQ